MIFKHICFRLHEGIKALPSAQQQSKPIESKVDILQMLKNATVSATNPTSTPSPALKNAGNDLLRVLAGNQQQQQQSPSIHINNGFNQPVMTTPYNEIDLMQKQQQQQQEEEEADTAESVITNKLKDLFKNSSNMNGTNAVNGNDILSMTTAPAATRRIIANGELTKPFYPPFMNMSPVASPNNQRNPNALLQALHGGLPPPPPPPLLHQQQQPLVVMPLLPPQQVIGLMGPEINRRFASKPMLSKPEFIQQLLNMIQCDPTFFDILYENYKGQMGPTPPNPSLPPPSAL
ncbi:MAG: hypothetical protein EXX96DRAFT_302121 [Benjaminiella poitrasii]|nr:MAG: hypothetical protein EXX96DRAFT_302121 [Benjaminiella poitrasii]